MAKVDQTLKYMLWCNAWARAMTNRDTGHFHSQRYRLVVAASLQYGRIWRH